MSHVPDRAFQDQTGHYLRTELLERIAHELRGPAGVTLGALDEIERALNSSDVVDPQALLSMARRGARRILRTAERLTRTAQLEAGEMNMATALLDVRDIVVRAAKEAEQIEGRKAIRLELTLSAQPCSAHVDANWLGAALGELFSQAIRCARRSVLIQVTTEEPYICVSVFDDRSTQVEVPATRFLPLRDRRDCALGWPLAHDVAQAHGGFLTLESIPGEEDARATGARATLSLRAG
jgi:signal transduction histidine kinase